MSKAIGFAVNPKRFARKQSTRAAASKRRWNTLGVRDRNRRDTAALAFARLGLLATRW